MKILTLRNILRLSGLDLSAKIKMVRHKDSREAIMINGKEVEGNPYDWYRKDKDKFIAYQSEQHRDVFKGVKYVVSLIGEAGTTARFIGVYEVEGEDAVRKSAVGAEKFYYRMREVEGFEELKDRVIIDWGKAAITWHQWLTEDNDKEVIAITPGFEWDPPQDYEDIILNYSQLKYIICEKSFETWKRKLSDCNCIYAISDSCSGKLYVGSTYNREGIWGRWKDYAETGHGNDVELKKLLDADPEYAKKYFTWSILQILPLNVSDNVAIRKETSWKDRLGRSVCALNKN